MHLYGVYWEFNTIFYITILLMLHNLGFYNPEHFFALVWDQTIGPMLKTITNLYLSKYINVLNWKQWPTNITVHYFVNKGLLFTNLQMKAQYFQNCIQGVGNNLKFRRSALIFFLKDDLDFTKFWKKTIKSVMKVYRLLLSHKYYITWSASCECLINMCTTSRESSCAQASATLCQFLTLSSVRLSVI